MELDCSRTLPRTSNRNELQISVSFNLDHRGLNDLDTKIGLSENAKKIFPKMTASSYLGQGGVQYFSANIKCKKNSIIIITLIKAEYK